MGRRINALTCSSKILFLRNAKKLALVAFVIFIFVLAGAFFAQPAKAQSVQILSHRGYNDSVGAFWIFGEFQSDSSTPIYLQHIKAIYYDTSNNVVDVVEWHAGFPKIVFPGQKSPFLVLEWNKSDTGWLASKIDHYSIEFIGSYVNATVPEVVVLSHKSTTDSTTGFMHVTGEVQNTGTTPANSTWVYATFYDSNGKVVCTYDDNTSSNSTAPGEKATFDIAVWTDLTPLIASYSVQAQAMPTYDYTERPTDFWQGHSLGQSSGVYEATITPSPSSPSPTPETPNEGGVPVPAYTYVAWAPPHENAAAATVATAVTVGVVTAVVSTMSNPVGTTAGRAGEKVQSLIPEGAKKWLEEFVSSKRKPVVSEKTGSKFLPTKAEALAYGVSLAALTIAFSYVKVPSLSLILDVLPVVFVTAVIVEVVKTYVVEVVARSKGLWAEHRLWYFGLAMFLITTFAFGIPFSSPSRNVYHSPKLTKRLNALVASAAVLVTLAFAAAFFGLLVSGFTLIGSTGLAMCLILGLVDAFPVEPLNGKAIYDHSKALWGGIFLVTLTAYVSWLLFL